MTRITLALIALFFSGQALADKTYGDLIAKLVRVYDGDTIYVDIETFPPLVGSNMPIRLRGINTPEIYSHAKCEKEHETGIKAKIFVEERLKNAAKIELLNISRGKYFRIVADVVYDGKPIAPEVINMGLGVVYGVKKDWCAD